MDREALKELSAIANGPFERLKGLEIQDGKGDHRLHSGGCAGRACPRSRPSTLYDFRNEPADPSRGFPATRQLLFPRPKQSRACPDLREGLLRRVHPAQVDDTFQHLSDIWRRNVPCDYFESFLIPRQLNRPSARSWLKDEIRRLKGSLEKYTGGVITDEALRKSIHIYNENRSMLRDLYEKARRSLSFSPIESALRRSSPPCFIPRRNTTTCSGDSCPPCRTRGTRFPAKADREKENLLHYD